MEQAKRRKLAADQRGSELKLIRVVYFPTSSGRPLKIKLNKPSGTMFGMTPTETTGEGTILFDPSSAKAAMVSPNFGGWNAVELIIEKP